MNLNHCTNFIIFNARDCGSDFKGYPVFYFATIHLREVSHQYPRLGTGVFFHVHTNMKLVFVISLHIHLHCILYHMISYYFIIYPIFIKITNCISSVNIRTHLMYTTSYHFMSNYIYTYIYISYYIRSAIIP